MRIWSNSTVLLLVDSIAIAIAQGYMLARARLTSHPPPILRVTAGRDDAIMDAHLLDREVAVYRRERERVPSKQRPHLYPVASIRNPSDHATSELECDADG